VIDLDTKIRFHLMEKDMTSLMVQENRERRATMCTKTRIGATVGELA